MVSEQAGTAEEFRQEVRAWLRENLPDGWGTPEYVPPQGSKESHEAGQRWLKKLNDAGYTAFSYPKEYGGSERPKWQQRIIYEEMSRTGTPPGPASNIGVAGPTILVSGQEWQKKRFLPKMLSGEEAWIQGFSEPNAGSDLANIQTMAVRDGDEWVVNGQKVWNSLWEFADFGVLVVKTDMEAPRHRNLSYFIFDCKSPGYSTRPLRQMTGGSGFCEMFFDNVRIPHENLMGELNMGWYAAMATLVAEREGLKDWTGGYIENVNLPAGQWVSSIGEMGAAVELAKHTTRYGRSLWKNSAYRQRIAQLAIERTAIQHGDTRIAVKAAKGMSMADEFNIPKLFRSEVNQRRDELIVEMIGAYSQLWKGPHAIDGGAHPNALLGSRAQTIGGGTAEINRNIIAERILGLPR